jgi:secreted Zn-dependent insulinase-like peptidase
MNLDSRAYSKLSSVRLGNENFEEYRRIFKAICLLDDRYDHETPEMWCSRVRDPFRQILEENRRIFSKNGYIIMYGKLIERSDRVYRFPTSYIYCTVCDSLVFIPESAYSSACLYRDIHFKRCINGDIISNKHARRKEILQSINEREFSIWQYKQYILQEETKINRLRLELFSQSTSHSEKDKLASVSYDHDSNFTASYENYAQSKANIAENTMPSAPNFEPACISHHVFNQKSEALNEPPLLPQKPVELMGSLKRYPMQRSAPEIRNLWNDRSNMPNISSRTTLSDLAEAYFDSMQK